jgi:hypothetical protein
VLIVSTLGVIVLTGLLALSSGGTKMNRAALSSVALQNAILLQEAIAQDIRQMGVDPGRTTLFEIGATSLSFYRVVFDGTAIRLRPVKYGLVRTARGNAQVCRTERSPRGLERTCQPAVLRAFAFELVSDPTFGGRYIRVSMEVLDEDLPPSTAPAAFAVRSSRHDLLARIPIPTPLRNPALAPSTQLLPEGEMLPLD